ncbi:tRNA lysidine(34) synthetase TilS [Pedobacter sp.]|nr:tRNA lysidine(34) synthetase TilS [Candidatus Saccharibacteria bacterium]
MHELNSAARPVYVLAISGGVDSMVLAETIGAMRTRITVIAHFDHGIRKESGQDEAFVRAYAERRGLVYVTEKSNLGHRASEEKARDARYAFLRRVQKQYGAVAIVTAHHQDDVIETMCINMLRGTGWRGLISLRSHPELVRPLLGMSKAQLVAYAVHHNIEWVEDRTNDDPRYLRNTIRQTVMRRMTSAQRQAFVDLYHKQLLLGTDIDGHVSVVQQKVSSTTGLSRYHLIMMPRTVGAEVLQGSVSEGRLERPQINRLLHFAKTAKAGKKLTVAKGLMARVTDDELIVYTPEI